MKNILLCILLTGMVSCGKLLGTKEPDFKFQVESNTFSLSFPTASWKLVNLQGTDSYVGYFENGTERIYFDYGWYGGTIDKNKNPKPLYYEETTIHGKRAVIAKESTSQGVVLTAIINRGGADEFTSTRLYIVNPGNEQEIIEIFRTHRFK